MNFAISCKSQTTSYKIKLKEKIFIAVILVEILKVNIIFFIVYDKLTIKKMTKVFVLSQKIRESIGCEEISGI